MTTIPARQSTALELAIGPILDADGVAVTGGLSGDFKIKKTTGNFAALNGSATLTHVSAGVYDLVLTTSDLDTVGLCCIAIDDTTNACASVYLQVIEEAIYDRDYAASAVGYITDQPVNVTKWLGTAPATPTTAGVPEVDVTYYGGTLQTTGKNVSSIVDGITNSWMTFPHVPAVIEVPASGTLTRRIYLTMAGFSNGENVGPDSPTVAVANEAGTSLNTRLGSTTMTYVGNGRYRVNYTSTAGDADAELVWTFTTAYNGYSQIVHATSVLQSISAKVDTVDDFLDTEVAAILAAVDTEIAAIVIAVGTTLPAQILAAWTTALTESYRADGATGTPAQILYELLAHHAEKSISGTTLTTKKIDGSTTAATHTLNSSTAPTSITRAA